jgi:drug/metabolite transporter (DMT)-like permease
VTDQFKGLLITTLGVLCVVPDALFIRLIDADAMTVAFWRLLLAGVVVQLVLWFQHGRQATKQLLRIGRWGLVYAFFAALSALLFVTSVKLTTVANTTIIIASMPVFAALISWLVLGETLSRRMLWTIALVFAGLLVIGYGSMGDNRNSGASLAGDLAAVAVSLCFAIALTAARKARTQSMIPTAGLHSMRRTDTTVSRAIFHTITSMVAGGAARRLLHHPQLLPARTRATLYLLC